MRLLYVLFCLNCPGDALNLSHYAISKKVKDARYN